MVFTKTTQQPKLYITPPACKLIVNLFTCESCDSCETLFFWILFVGAVTTLFVGAVTSLLLGAATIFFGLTIVLLGTGGGSIVSRLEALAFATVGSFIEFHIYENFSKSI